jgi:hypothetical protein
MVAAIRRNAIGECACSWVSAANPAPEIPNPPAATYARSKRCTSTRVAIAAAVVPAMGTSDHSAAVSGLSPSTDWRYCVVKMAKPTIANIATRFIATEPVKPRLRNSLRSIIGAGLRACRAMNAAPTATPAAIHRQRARSTPPAAISLMP